MARKVSYKSYLKPLKGRLFTRKSLEKAGLTGNHIRELLQSDQIDRVVRGVYCIPGQDLSEYVLFQMAAMRISSRSSVCLLSALSFYSLTDIIPKKVWLMVGKQKRTAKSDIRLFRTANPNWNVGIRKENGFSITSIERTLIDCLVLRKVIGTSEVMSAIKKAIASKQTTLSKLIHMAKDLGVDHRVLPYIEGLII
jgi:predicted transcriptional regulator of viral defense system